MLFGELHHSNTEHFYMISGEFESRHLEHCFEIILWFKQNLYETLACVLMLAPSPSSFRVDFHGLRETWGPSRT